MTDREQGILDIVMHNVLIFFISKSPTFRLRMLILLLALSYWLQPEVNKATLWPENASGAAMQINKL